MNDIVTVELPLNNRIFRLTDNEAGITTLKSIIDNLIKIDCSIRMENYHLIDCSIIRTDFFMVAYRYDLYKIVYIAFNSKIANLMTIKDNKNNIYKLEDIIKKMNMLDIDRFGDTSFNNMEIIKYNVNKVDNRKYNYKLEFKQEENKR